MKILILYTAVGQGHKSIAQNIAASLTAAGQEVSLADAYEAQDGKLIRIGAKVHRFMNVQAPWLWRFFYTSKVFTDWSLRFRLGVAKKNYQQVLKIINDCRPALIITTQTSPSAIVAYLKNQKLYTGWFGVAFSDFHLHRYWLYDQADFYLANIQEQKLRMVELGIPPEKIYVTGFNLQPAAAVDRPAVRQKFHINNGQKVILMGSGSLGLGLDQDLLAQLSANEAWHTIVVCGNNQNIQKQLSAQFGKPNISVVGFYQPMDELYAIADIFLTKPGGLSTVEALRFHLPMIITSMLPGQEEWNLAYLRQHDLVMPPAKDVLAQISKEARTGDFRRSLPNNPAAIGLLAAQPAASCLAGLLSSKGVVSPPAG